MDPLKKRILTIFLIVVGLAILGAIFDQDSNKTQRTQPSRISERSPIDLDLIKPYTERELRSKVADISTNESVVYNARKLVNQYPTNRAANNTWNDVIRTRKPRLGQQKFWACMHLADHDWGE